MQGPFADRLQDGVRIELTEGDAGTITGAIYDVETRPDGGQVLIATADLVGTRDAGVLLLTASTPIHLPDGGTFGGFGFTGTLTSSTHMEATEIAVKSDGGPLPIYFKVDRQ